MRMSQKQNVLKVIFLEPILPKHDFPFAASWYPLTQEQV